MTRSTLMAAMLPEDGTIAVGDQMWASFLIAFQARRLPSASFVDAEPLMASLRRDQGGRRDRRAA